MSFNTAISQLNAKYQTYLQLYTWHHLNIKSGRDTKVVSLSNDEFVVSVRNGKQESQHTYKFTSSQKANFRDPKTRTEKVLSEYIGPHFPPMGIHVINLWVIGLLGVLPMSLLRDIDVLVNAKGWVMKLFVKEEYALYFILALAIGHFAETVYTVLFLLPQIGFPMSKYAPWALFTFVFGYPVFTRLQILKKIASGTKEKST